MDQRLDEREVRLIPIFFNPSNWNWKNRIAIHLDEADSRKNKYLLGCLDAAFRHNMFERPICN